MVANNTIDDIAYYDRELTRLDRELAAVVRQYARAAEVDDDVAKEVEAGAFANRVQWLLYNHLGLRIGMTSDDWFWLNGQDDYRIEPASNLELGASGRLHCSLPEGFRQWTEPFAAKVIHSATAAGLSDYTVWLGNSVTLLDLPKVGQLIASGERLSPPTPRHQDEWAFVFRRGDRT